MLLRNRAVKVLALLIGVVVVVVMLGGSSGSNSSSIVVKTVKFGHHEDVDRDSLVEQRYQELQSIMKMPIDLPKAKGLEMAPVDEEYQRANATLLILARNSDVGAVMSTVRDIEKRFNSKFHYPYVFLNNKPFTQRFIDKVSQVTSGECFFESIEPEMWNPPASVNEQKMKMQMYKLSKDGIAYANKLSYHNMCRFYSINFYNHPRLRQFKYYWRFEPSTEYFCDIDYDVFKFMEYNNKVYGFTIALYDSEQTVESIWPLTMDFISKHPQYLHSNAAVDFLTEDMMNPHKNQVTGGYSTCHFWSNFEIADMNFYRGEAYSKWAAELENAGGFYYERWGDAPVHSIGVGLFADKSQIHWFRDIGYRHHPYTNSPNSEKCSGKYAAGDFTYDHLRDQNCLSNWWLYSMDSHERNLY